MKVVVTGAAGLTGGAVVRQLAARGHEVIAFVRREQHIDGAAAVLLGECRDPSSLSGALAGADALIHVAGISLGRDVAASGIDRLERLVAISSAGIYSRHRQSAATYAAGERAISACNPSAAFLRPTMIYGSSRDHNIHHILSFAARFGFVPLFGSGSERIQPIHYEDVARAACEVVEAAGVGPIDAGGASPLSVREALAAVFHALGRRQRIIGVPLGPALVVAGVLDHVRGGRIRERLERLSEDRSVEDQRLVALTGFRPREFHEGLRQQVLDMRREGLLG